jgi:hypothetical protein
MSLRRSAVRNGIHPGTSSSSLVLTSRNMCPKSKPGEELARTTLNSAETVARGSDKIIGHQRLIHFVPTPHPVGKAAHRDAKYRRRIAGRSGEPPRPGWRTALSCLVLGWRSRHVPVYPPGNCRRRTIRMPRIGISAPPRNRTSGGMREPQNSRRVTVRCGREQRGEDGGLPGASSIRSEA